MPRKYTQFGYRQVPEEEKQGLVDDVFSSVASNYDLMNDLMSLGLHRVWKRFAVEMSAVRSGHKILDLAGGTGDMAALLAPKVGPSGRVILADINAEMLLEGRRKLISRGIADPLSYVQANAQQLPFAENFFDLVTIAFGLRNVTDKKVALQEMYRVLKPGGRLLVLEFSKPDNPLFSKLYDMYSFTVLPALGRWIAQDEDSYRYLAESIRMHPPQQQMQELVAECGFSDCDFHNMTGGIVAVHRGIKP